MTPMRIIRFLTILCGKPFSIATDFSLVSGIFLRLCISPSLFFSARQINRSTPAHVPIIVAQNNPIPPAD